MQKPPLNWLRSFAESARLLNFTQAAQELVLTQAAVSKHIRGLEASLGMQLFIREAHGLRLTEQGKRFYAECLPLLEKLEDVTQKYSTRANANRLSIRSNISYSTLILPSRLAVLALQWPNITFDINNGIWQPDSPSTNAHLEIGYASRETIQTSETLKLLAIEDRQFPVAQPLLSEKLTRDLPLIQIAGYDGDWQWWLSEQQKITAKDNSCDFRDLRQIKHDTILRTDNSLTAYQLCVQGLGLVLARESMVQTYLDTGQLQRLQNSQAIPARDLFYARLTELGQKQAAAVELFALL